MATVYQLLSDLSQKKYSLKEILAHCNDIKAVQKVQTSFLKVTNYESWEEASTKYPHYTTSEKLEPFKKLDFSKSKIPDKFLQFCQLAKHASSNPTALDGSRLQEHDNYFLLHHQDVIGIMEV